MKRKTVVTVLSARRCTLPRTSNLPKYRKHKASKQAVVTLSGQDYYLGPHGSKASVTEYDRLIAEFVASGRSMRTERDSVTVSELLLKYAKHAKQHYRRDGKPTGEWQTQKPIVRLLKSMYGDLPVVEFGPLKLKALRLRLSEPREVKHGDRVVTEILTRAGVNRKMTMVRKIFRWGLSEELVPAEIVTALEAVAPLQAGRTDLREPEPVTPVSDSDVAAVLPYLTPTVRAMVEVQLYTGMRPNEVIQLRPCDIDTTGTVWQYRPQRHKTQHRGRLRIVAIGPKAQAVLQPFMARDPEQRCFLPAESVAQYRARRSANRVTPLSCGNRPGSVRLKKHPGRPAGEVFTSDSYRRAIHRACDRAGIERWSPNRLRHAAATKIRSEFGLEAARVILGHSSAVTTEIYAERDLAAASEVIAKLG